jgi:hypothetical protein
MARDFVTPEQIERAREVDLVEYLHRTEPGNIVSSAPGEYRLVDHDSLKISNGKFHWISRGTGGTNVIDYLVKVRNFEFKEAVRELVGDDYSLDDSKDKSKSKRGRPPPDKYGAEPSKQPEQKVADRPFNLPPSAKHNNDVIKYLKGRGIEEKIILNCIDKKLLYQSARRNCVFVGYDDKNTPKFACERGIRSNFKKDVAGSKKAFSFCMPPITADSQGHSSPNPQSALNRLYVFESPIDCLSHANLESLEVSDKSMLGFETTARKYGIEYGLQKNEATTPPTWQVYFMAKDRATMAQAFREFTNRQLTHQKETPIEQFKRMLSRVTDHVKPEKLMRQTGQQR